MTTVFRMLPVRHGDVCMIKSRRGSYLMDGGGPDGMLPPMLRDRGINKLRVAAGTAATPDRLGGILDLLAASYPVSEYWLPHELSEIQAAATSLRPDWETWANLVKPGCDVSATVKAMTAVSSDNESESDDAVTLILLGLATLFTLHPPSCLPRAADGATPLERALHLFPTTRPCGDADAESSRIIGALNALSLKREPLVLACGRMIIAHCAGMTDRASHATRKLAELLALTGMTRYLLAAHRPNVRYFRSTGTLRRLTIPNHPFICLNGCESDDAGAVTAGTRDFFKTAAHAARESDGLSFLYGDGKCGVLLCGDTRFSYLNKDVRLELETPTVIAAPRQGHCTSDRAYAHLASRNPNADMWVRGNNRYARKISTYFRDKPNKLCLINCVHRTVGEILLDYAAGRWHVVAGHFCPCF